MIELDLSLSYEECREEVKNCKERDLINYLVSYRDNLSPIQSFLSAFGSSSEAFDAVSDELLERERQKKTFTSNSRSLEQITIPLTR